MSNRKNLFPCILCCKAHKGCLKTDIYRKSSIKPPSLPPGGGGNNKKAYLVSVLHKEFKYKVDKLKYKKVGTLEDMQLKIRIRSEYLVGK